MIDLMPNPRVSVIIPNFNHARFLRKRIESVLRQTYQNFELILLDDCSTDDSRSILSEYVGDARVRIDFNQKTSGSTFKQWNKGVRLARGEYVWIAESDDYAGERLLERLLAILAAEPSVTFAYCRSNRILENGQQDGFCDFYLVDCDPLRWTADFRSNGREECEKCFVHSNPVPNASGVVFRKSIYERVGGADERLRLCGDWKLWASMALEGTVAYLSEPLNYFRSHGANVSSISRHGGLNVAESLEVVNWILNRVSVPEPTLEIIRWNASQGWVGAVMSLHVSLSVKWRVLKGAKALDPHAVRRNWRTAWTIARLKFLRHWRKPRASWFA
jgi:glycosyltransferase involved in cell wall biosynthesis